MPAASNQYDYNAIRSLDEVIREACMRAGIDANSMAPTQNQSVLQSIDLSLMSLGISGRPLWLQQQFMVQLVPGQTIYTLPNYFITVDNLVATSPIRRNVGGTPFSSAGGNAANCFDPTTTTGCTQTASDGYISYTYPDGDHKAINFVGIQTLSKADYTLSIDYTLDGSEWQTALLTPTTTYYAKNIVWWVIQDAVVAKSWRIKETEGATLAIEQIYFSSQVGADSTAYPNNNVDLVLSPISQQTYMSMPNKTQLGSVNTYYFNQKNPPTLTIWLAPQSQGTGVYTNLYGTCSRLPTSRADFRKPLDIPPYAYDAFISDVALRLAEKFNTQRVAMLAESAKRAQGQWALQNFERVTVEFQYGTYGR